MGAEVILVQLGSGVSVYSVGPMWAFTTQFGNGNVMRLVMVGNWESLWNLFKLALRSTEIEADAFVMCERVRFSQNTSYIMRRR